MEPGEGLGKIGTIVTIPGQHLAKKFQSLEQGTTRVRVQHFERSLQCCVNDLVIHEVMAFQL